MMEQKKPKPFFITFRALSAALWPLHLNVKADLDRLHDTWLKGSPSPDSIVRNPKGYDPRLKQAGNIERRLMLPTALGQWVVDVTTRRGEPMPLERAVAMIRKVGAHYEKHGV
jgi:hypothetical protein